MWERRDGRRSLVIGATADHIVGMEPDESRALIDAFGQSGYFTIRTGLAHGAEAEGLVARGAVRMVLVIPERFAADLRAGRPAPVELVLDGSDAKTATVARGYADAIARSFSATR